MKRINKALAAIAVTAAVVLGVAGCQFGGTAGQSAANIEAKQQAADSTTLIVAQPVPHFDWSQIRQTLIDVEGAEANAVQTTSFFFQQGMDHPYFVCNSIGFPIGAASELTNPQQVIHDGYPSGGAAVNLDQMDPSGYYKGDTAGTYVLCVNQNGEAEAVYAEPNVHTVAGPAAWDKATQTIVLTGKPSINFKVGK